MKKLNLIFKIFLTVSIVCSSTSMQGMKVDSYSSTSKYNEEYNNTNCLLFTMLHPEILPEIFSQCVIENDLSVVSDLSVVALPCPPTVSAEVLTQEEALATAGAKSEDQVISLENSIKTLMALNCTCKKFNQLLTYEKIGDFCKGYVQEDKDKAIQKCMRKSFTHYPAMRLPIFILLHAGASAYHPGPYHENRLLKQAIYNNDIQLIETLFKKYNLKIEEGPHLTTILAFARTKEIAQLVIDQQDNLYSDDILCFMWDDEYSSDLIPFYIQQGADLSKKIQNGDDYSFLHSFAHSLKQVKNENNFFKKAEYLIDAIPINVLTKKGKTPLDIAESYVNSFTSLFSDAQTNNLANKFITLLRKHGALTAKELKEGKSHEQSTCTIF